MSSLALTLLVTLLLQASLPHLAMDARQRQVVHDAAAAYPGAPVTLIAHQPTPAYRAFLRAFADALEQGGMRVSTRIVDRYPEACPAATGLRVAYGSARSGTVNAIAEALIRSGVVTDSIGGCPVSNPDELAFIVSAATVKRP